jgi:hypothetical protein
MKQRRKEIVKDKSLRFRVTTKMSNDFDEYCKKNNITKTKVIEEYLNELLYRKFV